MEFNVKLYDFMKDNECKMWRDENGLNIGVIITAFDAKEFIDCLEPSDFDDEGIPCKIKEGYIFVELDRLFENNDYKIKDYVKCFENYDLKQYAEEIKEFDGESDYFERIDV